MSPVKQFIAAATTYLNMDRLFSGRPRVSTLMAIQGTVEKMLQLPEELNPGEADALNTMLDGVVAALDKINQRDTGELKC